VIIGLGVDIIEIERIKRAFEKQPRFPERILTAQEYKRFMELEGRRQIEFLAGRFAAKEAYSKACGTGIGKNLSWHDIEILKDKNGKPWIRSKSGNTALLSISHSKNYVVSNVIIESSSC
jgi:holo-[acyl-carrier protein] synthase